MDTERDSDGEPRNVAGVVLHKGARLDKETGGMVVESAAAPVYNETSLDLPFGLPLEDWAGIGKALGHMYRGNRWWLTDWINYGERTYDGEMFDQYVDICGLKPGTLSNIGWVGRRVEPSRRREESTTGLTFSHHREVAKLDSGIGDELLDKAQEEGWSHKRLREEVRELTEGDNVHFSSESPEWYTPWHIIERTLKVLGAIDLDPCADPDKSIPAATHYTKEDDGLSQTWRGKVYMNPLRVGDAYIMEPCNCPCHSSVESVESNSPSPPITSRQILVIKTDISPTARTAIGRSAGPDKPTAGPMWMSESGFLQRSGDTHNRSEGGSKSGDGRRSTTTADGKVPLPSNGTGLPQIGDDASELSTESAPIAGAREGSPKTTSYPLATPRAPVRSSQTSSRPASDATVLSRTGAPSNGAPTARALSEFWSTSQTCSNCANCIKVEYPATVFLNPPYGKVIGEWVNKLLYEHTAFDVDGAIALLPSRTDTEWFAAMRRFPRCFVRGRLRFSGHENSAPFPSAIFYLGPDKESFLQAFSDLGDVYELARVGF